MNESPDSVELWGKGFYWWTRVLRSMRSSPFVSRMVFAMSRLLGYVDELGRQVDEASPRSRSAGLDDRIKEALADIPLESPTPQPAERPVHMVGTAVWPTGAAQVHNSNGPSDPSSEGEGSRVEPVLEGAVVPAIHTGSYRGRHGMGQQSAGDNAGDRYAVSDRGRHISRNAGCERVVEGAGGPFPTR